MSAEDIVTLKQIQTEISAYADQSDIHRHIQLDNRFHNTIIRASGHRLLTEALNSILTKIEIVKYKTAIYMDRRTGSAVEHADIVQALEERNESRAEEAMRLHLRNAMKAAIRKFDSTDDS